MKNRRQPVITFEFMSDQGLLFFCKRKKNSNINCPDFPQTTQDVSIEPLSSRPNSKKGC